MSFYSRKTPTARQTHLCDLCGDAIAVGERYVTEQGTTDNGIFGSRKLHTKCEEVLWDYFSQTYVPDSLDMDDVLNWWTEEKCKKCRFCITNDGDCDFDKDKYRWCSKFEEV